MVRNVSNVIELSFIFSVPVITGEERNVILLMVLYKGHYNPCESAGVCNCFSYKPTRERILLWKRRLSEHT